MRMSPPPGLPCPRCHQPASTLSVGTGYLMLTCAPCNYISWKVR